MARRTMTVLQAGLVAGRALSHRRRTDPDELAGRFRIDADWRRTPDGMAPRLDARTTIDVAEPVGAWRSVDPRRPYDAWRSAAKTVGLGLWATTIAAGWWLGSRQGRGPLGVLHDD